MTSVIQSVAEDQRPPPGGDVVARLLVSLGTSTGLDGLADLAADLVDADIAFVSVIGADHTFLIGSSGVVGTPIDRHDAATGAAGRRMPMAGSMCSVVRRSGRTATIDDVAIDGRVDAGALAGLATVGACAGAPIRAKDGTVIGAVCAANSVPRRWRTHDVHALEALARFAERELVRVVDTVERLEHAQELALVVGRLRHELSGDLTVVLGGIETALHPSASDEIRVRALTTARTDALRVIDVMDALLRTDARTSVRARPTRLGTIVVDATRALTAEGQDRLTLRYDDQPLVVAGRLLTRVVANLVDNALRHTPGCVTVEAGLVDATVSVTVSDEGTGFSPDALAQLYEPFSAGHDPADERGFGLGLFIVRELVQRLDGRIRVESGPTGSVVTVEVPVGPGSGSG